MRISVTGTHKLVGKIPLAGNVKHYDLPFTLHQIPEVLFKLALKAQRHAMTLDPKQNIEHLLVVNGKDDGLGGSHAPIVLR
ncbi:MAG: hypothetical protein JRN54_05745 [Nitrososphaerota archaeon]|jgi:hypothetical protein|nr:hypothetical protein [Nitrososphaerota archaeon]